MYIAVGIVVYTRIKSIITEALYFISDVEKEELGDEVTISKAILLISAGWIIFVPILVIKSYIERSRYY